MLRQRCVIIFSIGHYFSRFRIVRPSSFLQWLCIAQQESVPTSTRFHLTPPTLGIQLRIYSLTIGVGARPLHVAFVTSQHKTPCGFRGATFFCWVAEKRGVAVFHYDRRNLEIKSDLDEFSTISVRISNDGEGHIHKEENKT